MELPVPPRPFSFPSGLFFFGVSCGQVLEGQGGGVYPGRLTGIQTLGNGGSKNKGACTENYAFKHIVVVMVILIVDWAVVMPAGLCLGKSCKQGCYEYGYCSKGDVFFHGVLLG